MRVTDTSFPKEYPGLQLRQGRNQGRTSSLPKIDKTHFERKHAGKRARGNAHLPTLFPSVQWQR